MNQMEIIRVFIFLVLLLLMLGWEMVLPRCKAAAMQGQRRVHNLMLLAVDVAVTRLLVPLWVVGTAGVAESNGWGWLNRVEIGPATQFIISICSVPRCSIMVISDCRLDRIEY